MPVTMTERVMWLVSHLLTLDVTRVYRLCIANVQAPPPANLSCQFAFVSAAELGRLCGNADLEVDPKLLGMLESGKVICFAATRGDDLMGYVWFTENDVDPQHNTGGPQFKGIGLKLGAGVCYLFKALIVPGFRGQSLMSRMIHAACETLSRRGLDEIVTTTDVGNQAFQTSVERIGFVMVGRAVELAVFQSHLYWLPRLDERVTLQQGG